MKKVILVLSIMFCSQAANALTSGPDTGGYSMIDSNEVNGPSYAYEDISTSILTYDTRYVASGWNGVTGAVNIGFTFNFLWRGLHPVTY